MHIHFFAAEVIGSSLPPKHWSYSSAKLRLPCPI